MFRYFVILISFFYSSWDELSTAIELFMKK